MEREKIKNSEVREKRHIVDESVDDVGQSLDVESSAIDVVKSVEISEANDEGHGFTEDDTKYSQNTHVGRGTNITARVYTPPPIDQMIKQTVEAIEQQLREEEGEMKELIKNKKSAAYEINNKVIRIRFLNGLLSKLKRAAKLTEDFIVGLWKQYVKKMG